MVEVIDKSFIKSWGSIRSCCNCTSISETMVFANQKCYCSECSRQYLSLHERFIIKKNTDAQFKCPINKCDSSVSFRDFLNGGCCMLARLNSKKRRAEAQNCKNRQEFQELTLMMNELELLNVEEKDTRNHMKELQKELNKATAKYNDKKKEREKFQTELANAFSRSSEILDDKNEKEQDSRLKCNICFEKYNATDRTQCVLQCGHPACAKCLGAMADKICHICRKPFTEDNIIKLFYS